MGINEIVASKFEWDEIVGNAWKNLQSQIYRLDPWTEIKESDDGQRGNNNIGQWIDEFLIRRCFIEAIKARDVRYKCYVEIPCSEAARNRADLGICFGNASLCQHGYPDRPDVVVEFKKEMNCATVCDGFRGAMNDAAKMSHYFGSAKKYLAILVDKAIFQKRGTFKWGAVLNYLDTTVYGGQDEIDIDEVTFPLSLGQVELGDRTAVVL